MLPQMKLEDMVKEEVEDDMDVLVLKVKLNLWSKMDSYKLVKIEEEDELDIWNQQNSTEVQYLNP